MRIRTNAKALKQELEIVSKASTRRDVTALACVRLETFGAASITLQCTNTNLSLGSFVDCEVEEEGRVLVDARQLLKVASKCPDEQVEISVERAPRLTVTVASGSVTTEIPGLVTDNFPTFDLEVAGEQALVVPAEHLKRLLGVAYVLGEDDLWARSAQGQLVHLSGNDIEVAARANNANRGVLAASMLEEVGKGEVLIPKQAIPVLSILAGKVALINPDSGGRRLVARDVVGRYLGCQLPEGEYRPFREAAIDLPISVQVEKKALALAISRLLDADGGDKLRAEAALTFFPKKLHLETETAILAVRDAVDVHDLSEEDPDFERKERVKAVWLSAAVDQIETELVEFRLGHPRGFAVCAVSEDREIHFISTINR